MHRCSAHHLNSFGLLLWLIIGISSVSFRSRAEEPDLERLEKQNKVYVEPTFISTTKVDGEYKLVPYRDRRPAWGITVGIGYESYEPVNYEPNYAPVDYYDDLYGSPSLPMVEFQFAVKRNFGSGSLGVELGASRFENSKSGELVASTLSLTCVRLGVIYSLDAMSADPMWAPFVTGGMYTMLYKESLQGNSFNGNSMVAPYVSGGVAMSLHWIDKSASRLAFEDSGIQRSYLYADVRTFIASSSKKDPDLSSDFNWGAGLKLEF